MSACWICNDDGWYAEPSFADAEQMAIAITKRACPRGCPNKNNEPNVKAAPTYRIGTDAASCRDHIDCLRCGKRSYHPGDIENLYCGNCHQFHEREGK